MLSVMNNAMTNHQSFSVESILERKLDSFEIDYIQSVKKIADRFGLFEEVETWAKKYLIEQKEISDIHELDIPQAYDYGFNEWIK